MTGAVLDAYITHNSSNNLSVKWETLKSFQVSKNLTEISISLKANMLSFRKMELHNIKFVFHFLTGCCETELLAALFSSVGDSKCHGFFFLLISQYMHENLKQCPSIVNSTQHGLTVFVCQSLINGRPSQQKL